MGVAAYRQHPAAGRGPQPELRVRRRHAGGVDEAMSFEALVARHRAFGGEPEEVWTMRLARVALSSPACYALKVG